MQSIRCCYYSCYSRRVVLFKIEKKREEEEEEENEFWHPLGNIQIAKMDMRRCLFIYSLHNQYEENKTNRCVKSKLIRH